MPVSLSRRTVPVAGVDLELFEGGTGPPLLFLHDAGGLGPQEPILTSLAERFRVTAPLHPGFGGAKLPRWMNAVDDFAHAHLDLVHRLKLERATVVGASIGAWIAMEMATKTTRFIERLVLVGPLGIKVGPVDKLDVPDIFAMPQSDLDSRLYFRPERWRLDPTKKTDEELAIIAENRETLALVGWEPYLHNPKLKHRLPAIDRPTLILRGAADGLVSPDYAASFQRLIPGARLEEIAEAGHLAHREQAAACVNSIMRFCGQEASR